jgi:hypothetical protein
MYWAAFNEWKSKRLTGEHIFGKLNGLAADESDSTFFVDEITMLHEGLNGRYRSIEASIKICDTASGYFFYMLLTDLAYIKKQVGSQIFSKMVLADPHTIPLGIDPKVKVDYYVRGNVDADDGFIQAFHFGQVTALVKGLPGYKETLKEMFNPEFKPFCPIGIQDDLDGGKFYE